MEKYAKRKLRREREAGVEGVRQQRQSFVVRVTKAAKKSITSMWYGEDDIAQARKAFTRGLDFSVSNLSKEQVVLLCEKMLKMTIEPVLKEEVREKDLNDAIKDLVNRIKENYSDTAFHSFLHAADVAHLMFVFTNYFLDRLEEHHPFFLVFICLCHDLKHPGARIDFLHQHEMLTNFTYLEDFHIKETLEVVNSHPIFTELMDPELMDELVILIHKLIGATNISNHKENLKRIRECGVPDEDDMLQSEHLSLLVEISDLANVVRPFKHGRKCAIDLKIEEDAREVIRREGAAYSSKDFDERLILAQRTVRRELVVDPNITLGTVAFVNAHVKPMSKLLRNLDEFAYKEYNRRLNDNINRWEELPL